MAESTSTSKTSTSRREWARADKLALIGVLIAIVTVIIALLTVPALQQFLPWGPHVNTLEEVESLAPGVNIGVYQNEFGQPTFINYPTSPKFNVKEKEYVFVNSDFYLDAVTDMNDSVLYFAVTVRNGSFHPVFGRPFPITLGVSKFSDITTRLGSVVACQFSGARFSYYETYDFGGAADFLDYGYGVNPSGYFNTGSDFDAFSGDLSNLDQNGYCPGSSPNPATLPPGAGPTPIPTNELNAMENNLRSVAVINTYAVSTGTIRALNVYPYLGVNYDQISQLSTP